GTEFTGLAATPDISSQPSRTIIVRITSHSLRIYAAAFAIDTTTTALLRPAMSSAAHLLVATTAGLHEKGKQHGRSCPLMDGGPSQSLHSCRLLQNDVQRSARHRCGVVSVHGKL